MVGHAYLPGGLEAHIGAFVDDYNHRRYHQSLQNLTSANAYFGEAEAMLRKRPAIQPRTLKQRQLRHAKAAA